MTIKIENKPNAEGQRELTREEFLSKYSDIVKQQKEFSMSVEEFSEIMAKNPADVYIVANFKEGEPCEQIRQGDIYLFRAGDDKTSDNVMYAKYKDTITDKKEAKSMNLQLGTSITGDHRVVPLPGTTVKIYDCNIEIPLKTAWNKTYAVKLIEADHPFCVTHTEHGNITTTAGTYLACTQLDSRTMTRMKD